MCAWVFVCFTLSISSSVGLESRYLRLKYTPAEHSGRTPAVDTSSRSASISLSFDLDFQQCFESFVISFLSEVELLLQRLQSWLISKFKILLF